MRDRSGKDLSDLTAEYWHATRLIYRLREYPVETGEDWVLEVAEVRRGATRAAAAFGADAQASWPSRQSLAAPPLKFGRGSWGFDFCIEFRIPPHFLHNCLAVSSGPASSAPKVLSAVVNEG